MRRVDTSHELLDRRAAIATLDAALAGTLRGDGSVVVVRGDPGVGKTALLHFAAEHARQIGLRTLRATGAELEVEVPFGVLRRLLTPRVLELDDDARAALAEDAAGAAVRLVRSGGPTTPGPLLGVLDGIHWFLTDDARTAPLLLIVDDLHWADASTLDALVYLGRRLDGVPLTLLLAGRAGTAVDVALGLPGAVDVPLGPLAEGAVAELVAEVAATPIDPATADACSDVTGGNPLLVIELARAIADQGGVDGPLAVRRLADRATPSLADAIGRRVRRLSPVAVRVAEAVAVLGDGAEPRHVAEQADLDQGQTLTAVEDLVADVLLADELPLAFAHPLIRGAVLAGMPQARLAVAHERAAAVRRSDPPEIVAAHLLHAPAAGRQETVDVLEAAAAVAASRDAHPTAVRLLERALAEPADGEREPAVLAALGAARFAAGRLAEAVDALRRAAAHELPPETRVDVLLTLARALNEQGDQAAAVAALHDERLDGDDALRLAVERVTIGLYVDTAAAESLAQMRTFEQLAGDTPSERLALATAALARAFDPTAEAAQASALALRALADGQLLAEQTVEASQFGNALYALGFAEDYAAIEPELAGAFADARRRRSPFAFVSASLGQQQLCLETGRLTEAIAAGDSVLGGTPELRETPVALRWLSFSVRLQLEALLATGDHDAAVRLLGEWEDVGDLDRVDLFALRHGRGLVRLAQGRPQDALEDHLAFGRVAAQAGYEDRTTPWRLYAARAAHALGRADEARALTAEAVAITARWGAPGGQGQALHVAALVGPADEAPAALDAAIVLLRRSPRRLLLAEALVDAGCARRRIQDRDVARALLEEGMTLASRCDAAPLRDRAREELIVLGARPRRYQTDGVEGLTPSELRVARLAAEGRSNREIAQALFVTQKTVENHLTRTFRKLDVQSRGELAALLGE